jgi:molybdenum cofactor biosynthesis enzyme MoaA
MEEMLKIIKVRFPDATAQAEIPSATAKDWKVPGHLGNFGFISSMSNHFCGTCNRLRLTADGCLKVCLFDNRELNLKELIQKGQTDEEIII